MRQLLVVFALCLLGFFLNLGGNGIFDLDEGLYVSVAREMVLNSDYITPRVNNEPFYDKPPMAYWTAALAFKMFGVSEFSARFPSALFCLGLVVIVYLFGSSKFGERAGFFAASFLALAPIVLGSSRQLTTDAQLSFWIAVALICFFQGHSSTATGGRHWYWGFWAGCGLATMTKGAPGILLTFGTVGIYLAMLERFSFASFLAAVMKMRPVAGVLLLCEIVIPWHVAAYKAGGELFWQIYIVEQHVGRFKGGDIAHKAPFWFFVPGFILGFFPWSGFVIPGLLARRLIDNSASSNLRLFLRVWFWIVFVAFSASGSKLISYILPLYACAALIGADWLDRNLEGPAARPTLLIASFGATVVSTLLFVALSFRQPIIRWIETSSQKPVKLGDMSPELLAMSTHLFAALTLASLGVFGLLLLKRPERAIHFGIFGIALFVGVAVFEGLPTVHRAFCNPLQSLSRDAGRAAVEQRTTILINAGPPRRPSALFYLPDELLLSSSKGRVVEKLADIDLAEYLKARPAVAVTTVERATKLGSMPGVNIQRQAGKWVWLTAD